MVCVGSRREAVNKRGGKSERFRTNYSRNTPLGSSTSGVNAIVRFRGFRPLKRLLERCKASGVGY